MKDFRTSRNADRDYILDVETQDIKSQEEGVEDTRKIVVTFADGRVFNVDYSPEMLAKFVKQQENQAKEGVKNIEEFQKRKTLSGVMTGAAIVGGPVIGALAASTITNPIVLAIGTGVLTLTTAVPALCLLIRDTGKVSQLNKIKYRDEHLAELKEYPYYENALVGLSSRKRAWFEEMHDEGYDPFSITEIDSCSMSDYEQIVQNVKTSKKYQMTRRTATQK